MRIKQFILIAAVALAASSCAHSFEAQETQQPAIGFGTWAEQLTKAESRTQGENTFKSGDTFKVYGYNTISDTKSNIFNGDVVTAKGATDGDGLPVTSWTYSPLRFWDPTASSYTFYAASPSNILYESPVDGNGAYTGLFRSNTFVFAGNNYDVLVASREVVTASSTPGQPKYPSTAVELKFNHVASLIDVKVKKDNAMPADGDAKLYITSASIIGIETTGYFTVQSYDETDASNVKPVIGVAGWTSMGATDNYNSNASLPLLVTARTTYTSHSASSTSPAAQSLFANFIMMPQNLTAAKVLRIAYKIVTRDDDPDTNENEEISTTFNKDIAFTDFIKDDDTDNNSGTAVPSYWAPGTHYTYTLTIGANAITFTASINAWDTVNGYRYLLQ